MKSYLEEQCQSQGNCEDPPNTGDYYVATRKANFVQRQEDWGESFVAYIYPNYAPLHSSGSYVDAKGNVEYFSGNPLGSLRENYIRMQINNL